MGHVTLKTTCGEVESANIIDISYLIVDTMSHSKIILGRLVINALGAVISTWYLTLKYMLRDGWVGTIQGDEHVACKFYLSILETIKEELTLVNAHPSKVQNSDFKGWDRRLGAEMEMLIPIEYLKEVHIVPHAH